MDPLLDPIFNTQAQAQTQSQSQLQQQRHDQKHSTSTLKLLHESLKVAFETPLHPPGSSKKPSNSLQTQTDSVNQVLKRRITEILIIFKNLGEVLCWADSVGRTDLFE
jgi:hypothetical protein